MSAQGKAKRRSRNTPPWVKIPPVVGRPEWVRQLWEMVGTTPADQLKTGLPPAAPSDLFQKIPKLFLRQARNRPQSHPLKFTDGLGRDCR